AGRRALHVDARVRRKIPRTKDRLDPAAVTQRPEALVGEAAVVTPLLDRIQPHAPQPIGRMTRRHVEAVAARDRGPIGGAASVSGPAAAARPDPRRPRCGTPA